MIRTADIKDRETLEGLIRGGILSGDKIKKIVADWDFTAPPARASTVDSCLKYKAAAGLLGCSVGNIKRLVYAGDLIPFIHPGGQRASGVLASSVQSLIARNGSTKYRKPSRLSLSA